MHVHTFIADSAVQAVEQIRQQLGPEAVVLNLRQLPAEGLARLWQKPRIEVLAALPEPPPAPLASDLLAELRQDLAEIKQKVGAPGGGWRVASLLQNSGLSPVHVQRVLDEMHRRLGEQPPASLAEELQAARAALLALWPSRPRASANLHVFIGPPGVGKTTVLSKWLARAVLTEARQARVWRLDGQVANTAECLSVFAQILGVPLERCWPPAESADSAELVLVDLPGVNANDGAGLRDLAGRLEGFAGAQVHLVLNAAYEAALLLGQGRAFRDLPVADVILTHLDEEPRWGKLWDFVLGTNYTVSFLSAGQSLPGDFQEANPERILARFLP
jgi:flagellar biosynthesis protein FlhF